MRDIVRVVESYGGVIETPGDGSHYKVRRGAGLYVIPAGNALKTEVSDIYIKKLCRALGIEYVEFVKKL